MDSKVVSLVDTQLLDTPTHWLREDSEELGHQKRREIKKKTVKKEPRAFSAQLLIVYQLSSFSQGADKELLKNPPAFQPSQCSRLREKPPKPNSSLRGIV